MVNPLRDGPQEIPRGKKDNLKLLRHAIARYDQLHIIASCGALSLVPDNASRLFRIEAMAHVAGTLPEKSAHKQITDDQLQKLFVEPPLNGAIRKGEDPFPNIFVEEVPFSDGPQLIFPGPNSGTSFEFQRLTESIFHNEHHWPADFISHTYQMVRGVLALTNLLARRVGLVRGTIGDSSERGDVIIPQTTRFQSMRNAVTFSSAEFAAYLLEIGVDAAELADLIVHIGQFGLTEHSINNGTLMHKPVIRCGNQLIIAAPQRLISAANQLILRDIVRANLQSLFVRFYSEAVVRSIHKSLTYLRHLPIPFDPEIQLNIEGVNEYFYLFDSDKILYLLVVCDTLESFDHTTMEAVWGNPELTHNLASRAQKVRDEITRKTLHTSELFCLMVPCGVNRLPEIIVNNWPDSVLWLGMAADNLEVISLAEAGDKLLLWRFARKRTEALRIARFVVFDELDLFAAYRDSNFTFSMGDSESPPMVLIKPGYGRGLKVKVTNEQDWHPVTYFEQQLIVMVNTLYGTKAVPIYGMPDSPVPCVCVESLPCLVWVYPSNDISKSENALYLDFAATVAYWVWQLSPFIDQTLGSQLRSLEMMHIRLSLSPSFSSSRQMTLQNEDDAGVLATVPAKGTVVLSFHDSFMASLGNPDNEAERSMLCKLIPAIVEACSASIDLSQEAIKNVVEKFAPLGPKRMLLQTNTSRVPQLDPRDLPPYRMIQIGETEDVMDELSKYIISARALDRGNVTAGLCNALLHDMVTFLFSRIADVVKALNPEGLLEYLVLLSESLIRQITSQQLSLASRLETFGDIIDITEQLPDEMMDSAAAGIACRFIIEFVAAQPPKDSRPISLATYDHLQTLAAQLIRFGTISDSVCYNLSDVEISVLSSRRIKVDNEAYSAAAILHLGGLAFSRIAKAADVFRQHMGEHGNRAQHSTQENDIDKATRSEFGHSLIELVDFLNAVGDTAMELKPATPAVMEKDRLISLLMSELKWERGKVVKCLDFFSLSPRDTYMTPPSQSRQEDLYPWRFNREVSYLRRPLLTRERNGKTEIVWGHRHIEFARIYLIELCGSTRLKVKSPEMRSLLAGFGDKTGKDFNDAVYQHLQKIPQLVVKKRIKKVNRLRTSNLGDIDVLCVDPKNRTVWVIECKCMALARTPYEISNEIKNLTISTPKSDSILKKSEALTAWVDKNIDEIMTWLGIENSLPWRVRPLIVVDSPSITQWLRRMPIPIVSFDRLKDQW